MSNVLAPALYVFPMRHLPTLAFENAVYALLVLKPFNTNAYV